MCEQFHVTAIVQTISILQKTVMTLQCLCVFVTLSLALCPCQLFMCALWLLLQLAVALLYWDLPPAESSELQAVVRPKQRDDDGEEEEPLMGAEEELADTYGAVIVDPQQPDTQCSPEHRSSSPPSPSSLKAEAPDPFEDFSIRKGRLGGSSSLCLRGKERVVFYLYCCWFLRDTGCQECEV